MAKERDSLRNEVAQLRRSLEDIQSKHEEETQGLEERLQESNSGKEQAEGQYRNLLGNINKIKAQLGERMKADAVGSPGNVISIGYRTLTLYTGRAQSLP